jgi:aspartate 1-decarboxylase
MAFSFVKYTLTSGTVASPTFSYGSIDLIEALDISHTDQLEVYLNDANITFTTDYTLNESTDEITVVGATAASLVVGDVLVVQRVTKVDLPYVDYANNSALDADDLNVNNDQLLFLIQELEDQGNNSITLSLGSDCFDVQGKRICNLADGTLNTDAVNLRQLLSAVEGAETATFDNIGYFTFSGDGTETDFTLTGAGIGFTDPKELIVHVAGVIQDPTTSYTVSASDTPNPVITFDPAPANGAEIRVRTFYGLVKAVLQTAIIDGSSLAPDSVGLGSIDWGSGVAGRILVLDANGDPTLRVPVHTDITDFDAGVLTNRLDQLAAPTANVSLNNNKITSLQAGTSSTDGVNKSQMDAAIAAAVGNLDVVGGAVTSVGSVVTTPGLTGTNGSSNAGLYSFLFDRNGANTGNIIVAVKTSSGGFIDIALQDATCVDVGDNFTLQALVPPGGSWKVYRSGTPDVDLVSYVAQVFG